MIAGKLEGARRQRLGELPTPRVSRGIEDRGRRGGADLQLHAGHGG
jgi:hypothetical protein